MQYTNNLEYQNEVTNIIGDIFNIPNLFNDTPYYNSNPLLDLSEDNKSKLCNQINTQNSKLENKLRQEPLINDYLNIDIKMETGTGKTYVYVKTIFELNKKYGINKFIILVPSIAIKLGTQNFILDSYTHFQQEYGKSINLNVQSKNNDKNANKRIPTPVKSFVKTSMLTSDSISVLLLNDDYFNEGNYGRVREEIFLDEFITPAEAIRSTHPFLIIDEPHRFKDNNSAMTFIHDKIKPQCIIRFGATFPESNGVKDYKNLIYDLNSRKAIVDGLVKGVNVYIEGKRDIENIDFIVKDFRQGEQITVKYKKKNDLKYIEKEVKKGRVLSFLGENFTGVKLKEITNDQIILSNGLIISKGKISANDIEKDINHYNSYDFSNETQEGMIKLALEKHFEVEKANFKRDDIIKTICLFFIEDIASYRDRGQEQWIRNIFEKLLTEKLKDEIEKVNKDDEKEALYKKYLQATLDNLSVNEKNQLVHGGYFAEDTDKSEGSEYKQILINKDSTLNIYNVDGSFNTFRFIFSKWTLKEGWDNPNVFTIAKLRGSGSEISKLQEVGRGLRLPVDISMNRKKPNEEEFFLSYIVNNNESDFALKLIAEVCSDGITKINGKEYLSEEQINRLASKIDKTYGELLVSLIENKIIDPKTENSCYKIIDYDKFMNEYSTYLSDDSIGRKITLGKPKSNGKTKIRENNFAKIKELWSILNQNFIITYKSNAFDNQSMERVVYDSLIEIHQYILEKEIVTFNSLETKGIIIYNENKIDEEDYKQRNLKVSSFSIMKYSDYLNEISKSTNIPISIIHNAIVKYINEKMKDNNYNILFRKSVNSMLINTIISKKHSMIQGLFEYQSVNTCRKSTVLTDEQGKMVDSINSSNLGKMEYKGKATINGNYLYDEIQYDSPLELENINTDYGDKVEVYGKIPKNSIRIPKIDGCSCSPDFMYVLKDSAGNAKKMNLVVESKKYNSFDEDARGVEKYTKEYMLEYFKALEESLKDKNIDVKFEYQLAKDKVVSIIENILSINN